MTRRSGNPASRRALLGKLEADLLAELPAALVMNDMGAFLYEPAADTIYLDAGALAVFDLRPDEFDGRAAVLQERILPEDLRGFVERRSQALAESAGFGGYFRVRRSDGTIRWAHVQAAVLRDDKGTPRRFTGLIREAGPELERVERQQILESDRKRQADIVQATSAALSRALTMNDVLAALTSSEFLDPLGAVGVSLSVPEQNRLRRVISSTPEIFRDIPYSRIDDQLPSPSVFRSQEPLFLNREGLQEQFPRIWPYIRETNLTAAMIMPLAAQARPSGVLSIHYAGKTSLSPEERNLLLALAATVAQSVQRALLYDEEHAMAAGLQQAMLPARVTSVEGLGVAVRYQAAGNSQQIGGDWYDVVPLPGRRVGLVVGDVQGHDIHASAVMGQLRTALRAYATEGHSAAELMDKASRFLYDLDTERLATCIYVDLDPATGHARMVRAGHPGPLIRHAGRRVSSPMVEGGLPLGLPEYGGDDPYPVTRIQLAPGDTLLLCTDGLLEFHGTDLEAGELRIQALLRDGPTDLDELATHIVTSIAAGQAQEDDVALLLATLTDDALTSDAG